MSEEVKLAGPMRIIGGVLIVLSIIEFGIGGAVYGFLTNIHLGAWWGAICCFIAGFCGTISSTRASVITGCVFSIFAIIIAIAGSIVDGIAATVLNGEKACFNTDTGEFSGSASSKGAAASCALHSLSHAQIGTVPIAVSDAAAAAKATEGVSLLYSFYYNHPYYNSNHNNHNFYYYHPYYNSNHNNHNFYYYYFNNHNDNSFYYTSGFRYQCICTDDSICYGYDLASGDNCGSILTTYSSLLSASTAFLSILCVVAFIYSIFTCISCSSSSSSGSWSSAFYAAPPTSDVHVVQMQTGGAVYTQPETVEYIIGGFDEHQQQHQVSAPPLEYQQVPPVDYGGAGVINGVVVHIEPQQETF